MEQMQHHKIAEENKREKLNNYIEEQRKIIGMLLSIFIYQMALTNSPQFSWKRARNKNQKWRNSKDGRRVQRKATDYERRVQ